MQVNTRGQNPVLSHRELRYATKFMSSLMMSKQLLKHVSIKVHSIQTLYSDGKPAKGCIKVSGDDKKPRRFNIYLTSKLSRREQLLALAHEITHASQYARGELKDIWHKGITKWKGESFNEEKVPYYWRPWELDAYGHERALYYTYLDHLNEKESCPHDRAS